MAKNYNEIIGVILIASFLFLFLTIIIIVAVLKYNRRQQKHNKEKILLQSRFQQTLLQSQLEMQEQTFNTISNEIHDNVGQVLSLAKVQLNILEQGETLNKTLLKEAKESVSKAMTDLRDIAKSLNSNRIQQSGLPEITEIELQRINRSGILLTSLKVEGKEQLIAEQKKLIIFRIMQEAFQNIIKHSQAKNMEVKFHYGADKLNITIADNGIGFDKELVTKRDGLGLQNIVNRAALTGGKAQIDSIINKGTIITIISPYA